MPPIQGRVCKKSCRIKITGSPGAFNSESRFRFSIGKLLPDAQFLKARNSGRWQRFTGPELLVSRPFQQNDTTSGVSQTQAHRAARRPATNHQNVSLLRLHEFPPWDDLSNCSSKLSKAGLTCAAGGVAGE